MKIYIDSQIHIEDATKEVIDYIKRELEIPNPELSKKMAMGFYYRDTPKKIKAYSKNENTYVIPIGEIDNVWRLHPVKEDYTLNFGEHKKLNFPENTLKLYDYQEKAVQEAIRFKRGILSSKCGSGKSIMALEIIKRIGYKALIVCEKKEILEQFVGYLKNIFNMQKGEYGVIQEGKVEIGSLVTIALRQTLARIDLTPYKFEWGTIVIDEAQNARTDQLQNVLNIL